MRKGIFHLESHVININTEIPKEYEEEFIRSILFINQCKPPFKVAIVSPSCEKVYNINNDFELSQIS